MNLKNIVFYASALSTLAFAQDCATVPDLRYPEVRTEWYGTYKGTIDGNTVAYKVKKDECTALIEYGPLFTYIVDKGCDNTADLLNLTMDRKYLLENNKAEPADSALELIQKELVKPENKVKQEPSSGFPEFQ